MHSCKSNYFHGYADSFSDLICCVSSVDVSNKQYKMMLCVMCYIYNFNITCYVYVYSCNMHMILYTAYCKSFMV